MRIIRVLLNSILRSILLTFVLLLYILTSLSLTLTDRNYLKQNITAESIYPIFSNILSKNSNLDKTLHSLNIQTDDEKIFKYIQDERVERSLDTAIAETIDNVFNQLENSQDPNLIVVRTDLNSYKKVMIEVFIKSVKDYDKNINVTEYEKCLAQLEECRSQAIDSLLQQLPKESLKLNIYPYGDYFHYLRNITLIGFSVLIVLISIIMLVSKDKKSSLMKSIAVIGYASLSYYVMTQTIFNSESLEALITTTFAPQSDQIETIKIVTTVIEALLTHLSSLSLVIGITSVLLPTIFYIYKVLEKKKAKNKLQQTIPLINR